MAEATRYKTPTPSLRVMLVPLALAQFICSFAGSNMNVMINDISVDLHTTVQGVQVCITLFLLVMAALMIPCGKLTDRFGRKPLFRIGLLVYGVGALLSALSPGPRHPHPRQLNPRGRGHRIVDPARIHPHDHVVHRPQVAGLGLRGDQRHGRDRSGHGTTDRGRHHHNDHMAGCLRLPSARDRGDHGPRSSPRRPSARRPDTSVRSGRGCPIRSRLGDFGRRHHGRRPKCSR